MSFDINTLTLGEVSKVEEISGLPMGALTDDSKPKGRLMTAIAFVIKRREIREFTFKDAEQLTIGEVEELIGLDDEDDDDAVLAEIGDGSDPKASPEPLASFDAQPTVS